MFFIPIYNVKFWSNAIQGMAIWPFVLFKFSKAYAQTKGRLTVKHEIQHIKQWRRYWLLGFLFVYCFHYICIAIKHRSLTLGYVLNPLEVEAREIAALVPLDDAELRRLGWDK